MDRDGKVGSSRNSRPTVQGYQVLKTIVLYSGKQETIGITAKHTFSEILLDQCYFYKMKSSTYMHLNLLVIYQRQFNDLKVEKEKKTPDSTV